MRIMLDLKVIIGSTRPGRAADRVMTWITATAQAHGEFGVDVIDLFVGEAFGEDGQPRDHYTSAAAKIVLDDLAWWGRGAQAGQVAGNAAAGHHAPDGRARGGK